MNDDSQLPAFQRYQMAFSAHLRNPIKHAPPLQVNTERIAVYEEIVFNNLYAAVTTCFPIASRLLGNQWKTLVREFMQQYSANSPIFRKIPEEFLAYLKQITDDADNTETANEKLANTESVKNEYPDYLYSLCHYEWIELAVSTMEATADINLIDPLGDLLSSQIAFAPTMQILHYDFAVHHISEQHRPETVDTYLLVYRDHQETVKFIELNAITYGLITLVQSEITGREALGQIAQALTQPPESLLDFGLVVLEDLRNQGVILGTRITT